MIIKVLIVDDEVLVRKGISMGLDWTSMGFQEVYEAKNGQQALELAKTHQPQLVITDIKMPKMDGHELIDALKVYSPDSVVIVLSCLNDMDSVRKAMGFGGAIDYIPKLSMSTDNLKQIILRAKEKMVIKEEIVQKESVAEYLFTPAMEEEIKCGLSERNKEKVTGVIHKLFEALEDMDIALEQFVERHELLSVIASFVKEQGGNIKEVRLQGNNIYKYCNQATHLYDLKGRLLLVVDMVLDYLDEYHIKRYSKDMSKAIDYINTHYKEAIMLKDLSVYIGMSDTYLSRLFKKEMGVNFSDYLNEIRIRQAKKVLISCPDMPLYNVADSVGYNSESYFSRIFKKVAGLTPNTYRNQILKG